MTIILNFCVLSLVCYDPTLVDCHKIKDNKKITIRPNHSTFLSLENEFFDVGSPYINDPNKIIKNLGIAKMDRIFKILSSNSIIV